MDEVTQYYNDPNLIAKQQAADTALTNAGNYQSAASQLPAKLKQAIQEKLDYNKDLITQQNKAQAEYFAAPSVAREQYQNIWNPFEREKLVAQARSQAYEPYANLTDILGQRMGSISDVINAGTGAFNSAVTAETTKAQQAQQAYENELGLADKLASIAQWKYEQTHKGSGGSDDILASLIAKLNPINQNENQESPPWTPATAGTEQEWPIGSGIYWVSDAKGGWQ